MSRLRSLWWLALLALASAPLLWARWPVESAAPLDAGARPLSVQRLIEAWRQGAAAKEDSTADASEPALRVLSARAGDAMGAAEIHFEQGGAALRQRLDPFSAAALGAPQPLGAQTILPREALAAFGACAWILLAAPWLRRRLRPVAGLSADSTARAVWWVAHASQTGQAQQLAEQTLARLHALGAEARLRSIAELDAEGLHAARRLLLVASTTGEGDAPDTAAAFVRRLLPQTLALSQLQFAVLALGDRSYRDYCAFGRALDAWLQACAARPLFERIEVDDGDPQAVDAWLRAVEGVARGALEAAGDETESPPSHRRALVSQAAEQGGLSARTLTLSPLHVAQGTAPGEPGRKLLWQRWRLQSRTRLNPHSAAPALCEIELLPMDGLPHWEPGDVAVLQPLNPPARVQAWLAAQGLDGAEPVEVEGQRMPLREALRERALDALPMSETRVALAKADANFNARVALRYCVQSLAAVIDTVERIDLDLLERLPRLPPREYSIASTPASGRLRLIVRRQSHADGRPGWGSGTLLDSPIGSELRLRLRSNPGFRPPPPQRPLILIGAGSGLAGLLGLLEARIEQGAHANWLLFGERDPQRDCVLTDELQAHRDGGRLQHLDLCFSRDPDAPAYVQHALLAHAARLREWLSRGAHLRVCGSRRGMGEGVHACLIELLGEDAVEVLLAEGRYRREVF